MKFVTHGLWVLGASLGLTLPSLAQNPTIVVKGGTQDRSNVVVRVPASADLGPTTQGGQVLGKDHRYLPLKTPEGRTLFAQWQEDRLLGQGTPHWVFVLPKLRAQETVRLTVQMAADKVEMTTLGKSEELTSNPLHLWQNKPLLLGMTAYDPKTPEMQKKTFKVYHHLYMPDGMRVTNGPEGRFPHHRGLFYGFNRISYGAKGEKKADVWHCNKGEHQTLEKLLALQSGPVFCREVLDIGWYGQDDQKFANERRELTVYPLANGRLVEFASVLTPTVPGIVRLDGDPQHAGFHFRAPAEVEKTAADTYFLRPDGKGRPGQERNWDAKGRDPKTVNLPWNAMCFVLQGKRYTMVYLDHPSNPKEARGSERTYGRIGSYFEYDLTQEKPLKVHYRIWVQEGEMTVAECEALSKAFTESTIVEVSVR